MRLLSSPLPEELNSRLRNDIQSNRCFLFVVAVVLLQYLTSPHLTDAECTRHVFHTAHRVTHGPAHGFRHMRGALGSMVCCGVQNTAEFDSTQELRTVCELNRITKADFEQKSSEVDI